MAEGKWIRGLQATMPPCEAAREVLAVRLQVVREYLPLAVYEGERDPENVHQLRVATRRADAALRIFRNCLPRRVYKNARVRLRGIRQAAGSARDWDVFLIELQQRREGAAAADHAGLDFLVGYALGQRVGAQSQLQALDLAEAQGFDEFVSETLAASRDPEEREGPGTLQDRARTLLTERLHDLYRTASGDLKDYEHLHQVRIAGKRLRYAMEVFGDCFTPPFRELLYPQVEEMQAILGRANDSHVGARRLASLRDRVRGWGAGGERLRPGVEGLLRFHQRRLPQERRRFLRWWEEWRTRDPEKIINDPITIVS